MLTTLEKTSNITKKYKASDAEPAMVAVLKKLTNELALGRLKSGQSIKESVLAKKYGLSRNAVREALNQIVGWGLFEYVPYKGYQVKKFTINDLIQWDELREALEPIAARRLAKSRDPETLSELEKYYCDMKKAFDDMDKSAIYKADFHFHLCVVEHCGNYCFSQLQTVSNLAAGFYFGKSIMEANQDIQEFLDFEHELRSSNKKEDFQKLFGSTIDGHRKMYEAISTGDEALAEELFRHHAHNQVSLMERYIKVMM